MWDSGDLYGFNHHTRNLGTGQINPDCDMGQFLIDISKDVRYKKYLEIGTWNGLGSTRCFVEGFRQREKKDFEFYSVECNYDKCIQAQQFYKDMKNVHILHAKVVKEIPDPSVLMTFFKDYNSSWHEVDLKNLENCPYLFDNCSKEFDVILFDGGEFTTYFEYLELKDHCKVIICDDCRVDKTSKIRQELLASSEWQLIKENIESRNGWCAFERVSI